MRINFGCGQSPIGGFRNFDNSPALKLAKWPVVYFFLKNLKLLNQKQLNNVEWNKDNSIEYCDVRGRLSFDDEVADVIYSSHMLEHLSKFEATFLISECFRILRKSGVLRIAVPDLRKLADSYIETGDADRFMADSLLAPPAISSIANKVKIIATGYRHHQWMYDGESLSQKFREAGFEKVFVHSPGESFIKDNVCLNLREREDTSVYVEGVK